ncbi:hypothetical protein EV360DRAFT_90686, partial [Lentinula raphanica]
MAPPRKKSTRAPRGRKRVVKSARMISSSPSPSPSPSSLPTALPTASSFVDDEATVSKSRIGQPPISSDEDDGRPGPDDRYELDGFVVADDVGDLSSLTTDSDAAPPDDAIFVSNASAHFSTSEHPPSSPRADTLVENHRSPNTINTSRLRDGVPVASFAPGVNTPVLVNDHNTGHTYHGPQPRLVSSFSSHLDTYPLGQSASSGTHIHGLPAGSFLDTPPPLGPPSSFSLPTVASSTIANVPPSSIASFPSSIAPNGVGVPAFSSPKLSEPPNDSSSFNIVVPSSVLLNNPPPAVHYVAPVTVRDVDAVSVHNGISSTVQNESTATVQNESTATVQNASTASVQNASTSS